MNFDTSLKQVPSNALESRWMFNLYLYILSGTKYKVEAHGGDRAEQIQT